MVEYRGARPEATFLGFRAGRLSELVSELEYRHPATRFRGPEAGSAVAVRMSARDREPAEIEGLYVTDRAGPVVVPTRSRTGSTTSSGP